MKIIGFKKLTFIFLKEKIVLNYPGNFEIALNSTNRLFEKIGIFWVKVFLIINKHSFSCDCYTSVAGGFLSKKTSNLAHSEND